MQTGRFRSRHFERTLQALKLAAPFALASRYENGLAHCVEASICGAAVLSKMKIKARAVPCAIMGANTELGVNLSVGLTAQEFHARLDWGAEERQTLDEWLSEHGSSYPAAQDFVAHMVIEASFHGERALVDLTLGQLRQDHGVPVPPCEVFPFGDWPVFEAGDWMLQYAQSPRPREILREVQKYENKGLADDFSALMDGAIQCSLDIDLFMEVLAATQPEQFRTAASRLAMFLSL